MCSLRSLHACRWKSCLGNGWLGRVVDRLMTFYLDARKGRYIGSYWPSHVHASALLDRCFSGVAAAGSPCAVLQGLRPCRETRWRCWADDCSLGGQTPRVGDGRPSPFGRNETPPAAFGAGRGGHGPSISKKFLRSCWRTWATNPTFGSRRPEPDCFVA